MEISIINQRVGIESLYLKFNEALSCNLYKHFYALVAYLSWDGIGLIHKNMEKFYDEGNELSMIIGVANNPSEHDVLRYLKQRMPKAKLYVFNASNSFYEFHPKLYHFKGMNDSLLFVGSNNFTGGGLHSNSECCVRIKLNHTADRDFYSSIIDVWSTYIKPKAPFSKANLRRVDDKLLSIYSKCVSKNTIKNNSKLRKALVKIFPSVSITRPSHGLTRPVKNKSKISKLDKKSKRYFILEVKKETGAEGTQVQLPIEAIREYFKVSDVGHQTIELKVENNPVRPAVICHFKNNTHRISFPEIAKLRRPFIMKYVRAQNNLYKISFIKGHAFKNTIDQCTNQVRQGGKRWGIY